MIDRLTSSSTFWVCLISWGLVNYQWTLGGVSMTALEYSGATAAIWALWRHREHYKEK